MFIFQDNASQQTFPKLVMTAFYLYEINAVCWINQHILTIRAKLDGVNLKACLRMFNIRNNTNYNVCRFAVRQFLCIYKQHARLNTYCPCFPMSTRALSRLLPVNSSSLFSGNAIYNQQVHIAVLISDTPESQKSRLHRHSHVTLTLMDRHGNDRYATYTICEWLVAPTSERRWTN